MFAKLNLGPDRPIHDLYSFILGAYVMIVMSSLLNIILQKYHSIKQTRHIHWNTIKTKLIQKVKKVVKFLYIFIICGFVIPFLIGIILDLYAFMPLRLSTLDEKALNIYLTVDWAIGVVGLGIVYGIVKILPNNGAFREAMIQFNWDNLDNLDTWYITKKTMIPIIMSLLVTIILPSLLTVTTIYMFGKQKKASSRRTYI